MKIIDVIAHDVIELPSKNASYSSLIEDMVYQVIFRNDSGMICVFDFLNENDAEEFLKKINGDGNE